MEDRQSGQSVCATLSQPHYISLCSEVRINGIASAVNNRMKGVFTENAERDVKAMLEIAERSGLTL